MSPSPVSFLLLNGAIVILVGVSTGFPLRHSVLSKSEATNAWRIAHSVLIMDGLFMLVMGVVLRNINLDGFAVSILAWSLVCSGYGFTGAFILGAWKGLSALTVKPYGLNTALFGAHVIGALGSLTGVAALIYSILTPMC